MSLVNIKKSQLTVNSGLDLETATALDVSDGAYVDFTGKDGKTAILLTGSGSCKIKAGDSFMSSGVDLDVTVAGTGTVVQLDSGAFKITQGQHKGKVHITGDTSVKVQAVELV